MAAAQYTDSLDFYVAPFDGLTEVPRTWMVYRGKPAGSYVAVCTSRAEAVMRATALSKVQRTLGKSSIVYVRETPKGSWHIVQG